MPLLEWILERKLANWKRPEHQMAASTTSTPCPAPLQSNQVLPAEAP